MSKIAKLSPFLAALFVGFAFAAPAAKVVTVNISDLEFKPPDIAAHVGDTVQWINGDILDHTATLNGDFDIVLEAGKSGETVLSRPGEFEYICRYHPTMTGRIKVE